MNDLIKSEDMLADIQNTQKMCAALLQSPHYKKIGPEGIYAIVEKAKSIGVNPLDALNGGMYYVQGKVELNAMMMNDLIRQHGHSITKSGKSTPQECILHGKRKDNGDTWVASFSIEEAKRAGIYRGPWIRYPQDMLFARALSRLARQLFPDVIKGCYIQGEIDVSASYPTEEKEEIEKINEHEYTVLDSWLEGNDELRQNMLKFIKEQWGIDDLKDMPKKIYTHSLNSAIKASKQKLGIKDEAGE